MNNHQLKTIEAFDASAVNYNNTIARLSNYDHIYDFLAERLSDGQTVLELACGPANVSRYLLQQRKLLIIGYDLSEEMLRLAKESIPHGVFEQRSIIDFEPDVRADLVVNSFGLPFLNKDQVKSCLSSSYAALESGGLIYLSFMEGDREGLESPSFNPEEEIYFFYHQKPFIMDLLSVIGFSLVKEWILDYTESDGSITKDIIIISEKC